jgi:hypothetical protein
MVITLQKYYLNLQLNFAIHYYCLILHNTIFHVLIVLRCPPTDFSELFQLVIDQICDIELTPGATGPAGPDKGPTGPTGPTGAHRTFRGLQGINWCSWSSRCCWSTRRCWSTRNSRIYLAVQEQMDIQVEVLLCFLQTTVPTQPDFDSIYGSIEGFGVNYIGSNNTIRPGDIWIEPCVYIMSNKYQDI